MLKSQEKIIEHWKWKTHTDQYLNFESHHPLPTKLVVRPLFERADMIMEPEAQKQEIIHVNNAFSVWVSQLVLQQSGNEDGQ